MQGIPVNALGFLIIIAYGAVLGTVVGAVTGTLAQPNGQRHYFKILAIAFAAASIGAAIMCVPFSAPAELVNLMVD